MAACSNNKATDATHNTGNPEKNGEKINPKQKQKIDDLVQAARK